MIKLVLVLFGLFWGWSFLVFNRLMPNMDKKVYDFFLIKEPFTKIFKSITFLGSTIYFIIMATLLLFILDNKKIAAIFIILLIIDALIVGIFKRIFKRERPKIRQLVREKGYSYPSGHTFTSCTFYGFIIFLTLISNISLSFKIALIIILILVILLVGISRIYLGVHYFSDVIGAYLLSTSYLLLFIWVIHNMTNII